MHEAFCAQIPLLLDMMAEYNKYTHRQNKVLHERKKFFKETITFGYVLSRDAS
jgi:hypothetical protein